MKVRTIIPNHQILVLSLLNQDYVKLYDMIYFAYFSYLYSSRLVFLGKPHDK